MIESERTGRREEEGRKCNVGCMMILVGIKDILPAFYQKDEPLNLSVVAIPVPRYRENKLPKNQNHPPTQSREGRTERSDFE